MFDFLKELRRANIARNDEWNPDNLITLSFRGNELSGEVGEALELILNAVALGAASGRASNISKKIERERLGLRGTKATSEQLAEELADVIICADLIAMDFGIDLIEAITMKFNKTSTERGLSIYL
jgi:NTP pyrophosphatase (non-canonical NTP hydrolase)